MTMHMYHLLSNSYVPGTIVGAGDLKVDVILATLSHFPQLSQETGLSFSVTSAVGGHLTQTGNQKRL